MLNQISVFLENRAGQLLKVTNILSENNINIRAVNIAETSDYGILRLVCEQSEKALSIIKQSGFTATMAKVVAAAVPDRAGGLNELLNVIANEDIDIEYMYSIFGKKAGLAYMIFKVEQPEILWEVLEKNGFDVADGSSLSI